MILRQAKQKRQAQKEREQQSEADSTTITKLNVKITNLHKVCACSLLTFSLIRECAAYLLVICPNTAALTVIARDVV